MIGIRTAVEDRRMIKGRKKRERVAWEGREGMSSGLMSE